MARKNPFIALVSFILCLAFCEKLGGTALAFCEDRSCCGEPMYHNQCSLSNTDVSLVNCCASGTNCNIGNPVPHEMFCAHCTSEHPGICLKVLPHGGSDYVYIGSCCDGYVCDETVPTTDFRDVAITGSGTFFGAKCVRRSGTPPASERCFIDPSQSGLLVRQCGSDINRTCGESGPGPCVSCNATYGGICFIRPGTLETGSPEKVNYCCTSSGWRCPTLVPAGVYVKCKKDTTVPPPEVLTGGECKKEGGVWKKINCVGRCPGPSGGQPAEGQCVACGAPNRDFGVCAVQPNDEIFDSCCPGSVPQLNASGKCECKPTKDAVYRLFTVINGLMIPIAVILGIFLIVLKGYKIMTSQGDPQQLQEGKEGLTSAIIGLIFVLLAVSILRVIIKALISGDADPFGV